MDDCAEDAGACRDGHSDEVFAARTARIPRLGINADVEAREPARSADEEQEADDSTEVLDTIFDDGIARGDNLAHAPEIGEQAGRDAEGDDIGKRVELAAEGAGG